MKKALLVGINTYQHGPLRGCVNDVIVLFQVLTTKFGFKTEDIRVLTDYEATKKNILAGLDWLTKDTKPEDHIVFHYSGHGSQVTVSDWTDNPEPDGRDEIICTVDMDWRDPLRDHEIGAFFKRVPKDCTSLVILDCCHSGTGLRNGFGPISDAGTEEDFVNRFISPPVSNTLANPSLIITDDLSFDFPEPTIDRRAKKNNFLISTAEQGDTILITGCQDNQTSADAWIGNKYRGAMTFSLVRSLARSGFDISYKRLVTGMNRYLDKQRYTQNPQLECRKKFFNRKFLK